MTRERAIDIIKCLAWHTRPNEEDVEQAIKVLEQEPCEDAVSRQAVLDNAYAYGNGLEPEGYCVNVEDIQSLPPVTPTRNKGKWEYDADKDKSGGHCSRCGHFLRYGEKTNFCPDCGAEMEGEGW